MTGSLAFVRLGTPDTAPSYGADDTAVRVSLPRRIAYTVAIAVVAVDAAWNSYWHMVSVALRGHQDPFLAYTLPFSVDGMVLVATLAIAEDKAHGRRARGWARFAFWLGAIVSVAANIASVVVHHGLDALSIAVSAWPPVALLVVVEIMAKPGRPRTGIDRSNVAISDGTALPPEHAPAHPAAAAESATPVGAVNGASGLEPEDVAAVADMIAPALTVANELVEQGRTLSRETLTEVLRDRGHTMSNARASTLVKIIKAGSAARSGDDAHSEKS